MLKVLGVTIQHLVTWVTRRLGFVHLRSTVEGRGDTCAACAHSCCVSHEFPVKNNVRVGYMHTKLTVEGF
jgi:hypothetical protein